MTSEEKKQEKTKGELSSYPKFVTPLPSGRLWKERFLPGMVILYLTGFTFFISFSKASDPACCRLGRGAINLKGSLTPRFLKKYL